MSVGKRTLLAIGAIHDFIISVAVFYFAHQTVIGAWTTKSLPYFYPKALAFGIVAMGVYFVFSLNRGLWRYVSIPDLVAIVKASLILVSIYVFCSIALDGSYELPLMVPVFMFSFLLLGLGGPRLAVRLLLEGRLWHFAFHRNVPAADQRNVLIYPLNDNTELFLRALGRNKERPVAVAGILDDAANSRNNFVQGHRVLGDIGSLRAIVENRAERGVVIKELVITDPSVPPAKLASIVEKATNAGITVSRLPDLTDRQDVSESRIVEPKPIKLADLLGRPEVKIDTVEVARLIDGKCVVVTGAGGSIGSELARQVATFNPRTLVLVDSSEYLLYLIDMELRERFKSLDIHAHVADVRDRARTFSLFERFRPDVVFHAAALKHVPLVEDNPIEAIKTNIFGTKNVADAALSVQSRAFVMISTDKAVNPTNIMGASKRAAEAYCQTIDLSSETTRFATVRFGNVIGSNGSVVPRFQEQIAKGGPVTVTHPEIVRFFMSIPEAVRLVLQASGHGMRSRAMRGKILVLDMGEPVNIVDLATKMIQLAGLRPRIDIKIEFTGLRPGEKLYEELFDDSEVIEPMVGRGYAVATPRVINEKILQKTLMDLRAAADAEDVAPALMLLSHIVPEYSGSLVQRPIAKAPDVPATSSSAAE